MELFYPVFKVYLFITIPLVVIYYLVYFYKVIKSGKKLEEIIQKPIQIVPQIYFKIYFISFLVIILLFIIGFVMNLVEASKTL
jgi:hypothetical protein